ncbi:MAG: hypothetical protein QOG63_2076 [Thermoleophilaceae bacterium]|jgi:hypothetical protein|nr:hypothetical protein [Thermoleophilaceae bacterium]
MVSKGIAWRWLVLMLACCGLVGSLLTGPADAKKRPRKSACQKLKGKDLAPARSLKLVAKRVDSVETDLKGCQLPRGEVHIFAIRLKGDTTTSNFKVESVASRWALVSARSDSQYASDLRVWVFDIAKGRVLYTIERWSCMTAATDCAPRPPDVGKGIVDNIGKSVLAFTDLSTTTITGFGTDGGSKNFDSGPSGDLPASSLTLSRGVASWLHSGQPRSAQLP